jgi:hypothetical protein
MTWDWATFAIGCVVGPVLLLFVFPFLYVVLLVVMGKGDQ